MGSIFDEKEKKSFSGFKIDKQHVSGAILKKDIQYVLKHLNDKSTYNVQLDLKFTGMIK